jgi:hypothetical protein
MPHRHSQGLFLQKQLALVHNERDASIKQAHTNNALNEAGQQSALAQQLLARLHAANEDKSPADVQAVTQLLAEVPPCTTCLTQTAQNLTDPSHDTQAVATMRDALESLRKDLLASAEKLSNRLSKMQQITATVQDYQTQSDDYRTAAWSLVTKPLQPLPVCESDADKLKVYFCNICYIIFRFFFK